MKTQATSTTIPFLAGFLTGRGGSAVAFTVGGGTTRYGVNQHERGMADGTPDDANAGVAYVTAVPVRGVRY